MRASEKGRLATLLGGAACVLAACSVDTSGITFVPDGPLLEGGALNKGGSQGKAGSDDGSEGGEAAGGNDSGGSPVGGSPAGGAPTAGAPPATAGSNNPGGGMGGMGGMPPMNGYPCSRQVKPDRLIADFSGVTSATSTWMDATSSETYGLYTFPPMGGPLLKLGDGKLTAEAKVSAPSGFGIWFSVCADAKAAGYTAIRFQLTGGISNGQPIAIRVGVGSNANRLADPAFQVGGCVPPMGQDGGYCRPPATEVQVDPNMPPAGQAVVIPFDQFRNGSPAPSLDPTQVSTVEWGFIYLNGQPAYDASITVDDVRFE